MNGLSAWVRHGCTMVEEENRAKWMHNNEEKKTTREIFVQRKDRRAEGKGQREVDEGGGDGGGGRIKASQSRHNGAGYGTRRSRCLPLPTSLTQLRDA
eukprot:1158102-Pelagomonas_calceolata.AAC.2